MEQITQQQDQQLSQEPKDPGQYKLKRNKNLDRIRSSLSGKDGAFKSAKNLGSFFGGSKAKFSRGDGHQGHSIVNAETMFSQKYSTLEILGQGTSGVVKLVKRLSDEKLFVAKMIRITDTEYLDQVKKEYSIHSELNHPSIAKTEELISTELDDKAFIIMEYCDGGSLQAKINQEGPFEETKLKPIITKILEGIQYMHEKKICHRDIKPANIILTKDGGVKIIDFSISYKFVKRTSEESDASGFRKISLDDYCKMKGNGFMLTNTGTNEYKAPEIILGAPYNQSVDVWALGVLTYYALSGSKPFKSEYLEELFRKISNAKLRFKDPIWKSISQEAKTFIGGCLSKSVFMRMSAEEGINHHWIKGYELYGRSLSNLDSCSDFDISYKTASTIDDLDEQIKQMSPEFRQNIKKMSVKKTSLLDITESSISANSLTGDILMKK